MLDVDRGYWGNDADEPADDDEPTGPRMRRVIPFVEDTRNCLLIKPVEDLDAAAMASLEAAVKHAIQVEFQLEEGELSTEPLPSLDARRWILLYESAEGGAGVLRRLADDRTALPRPAPRRLDISHAHPDPGAA